MPFSVTHTSSTLPQHPQNTLWNTPLDIFSSKYLLLWVREQNTAFIMDFGVICNFSPMGGHLSPFWLHIPPHTPHTPQNTVWNTPLEIFSSKYVLVWVREQNSLHIEILSDLQFFPVGGHILPFWSHIPPHTLHTPPKYCVEYSSGDIFSKIWFVVGMGTI